MKLFRGDVCEDISITAAVVLCHGQAQIQEVAAILCAGTGNFALVAFNEAEALGNHGEYVGAFQITLEQEVEARAAAHGAEIEHLFAPLGIVAQPGRPQMLNGVNLSGIHHRLQIGTGDAQIKGGYGLGTHHILAGDIKPGQKTNMVNGKTGDFFHENILFFFFQ